MRHTRFTILLTSAAVLVAACGGAGGGPAEPARGASGAGGLVDFVRCMRRHGVALGDPIVEGDRVEIPPAEGAPLASRADFEAATAACEDEGHSRFGSDGERRRLDRRQEEEAVAFARCVRRKGIELPDPRFQNATVSNWDPEQLGIDLDDPEVVAVGEQCTAATGFDPWEEL